MNSMINKWIVGVAILLTSCTGKPTVEKDFIENLLDLTTSTSIVEYHGREYIQLRNLYDTLTHNIPDDKDEKIMLVERLKSRGFEITDWGRGNYPPLGPRIVIVEMKKDKCVCEVSKIYYATVDDSVYQMAEGINCKRVK